MIPDPFGHPAGTGRPPAPDPGERVITGAQLRSTREWLAARTDVLADWTCAERVLATVGALVAGGGTVAGDDLAAALRDQDTVDVALDLLTDAGVGCGS